MTAPEVVTVVVVSYNAAGYLGACLAGLAAQTLPRHRFEVVVVDNHSGDGSAGLVRERFPWVRVVAMGVNAGFTGGNNAGASLARGDRVALLNPDTVPDPHWLEELLRAAGHNPHRTACSKLVFLHDPATLNGAGLELLRDGRGADRGFRRHDRGQYERREPVFAGCGAAVLLRVPAGGEPLFDPRLFLYYEDLERGWRDRLRGSGPVYASRSVVRHAHGAAAGDESPVFWFHVERNRALAALKNADWPLAVKCAAVLAAKVPEAVVRSLRGPRTGRARWAVTAAVARALASYVRHAPAVLLHRLWAGRCG